MFVSTHKTVARDWPCAFHNHQIDRTGYRIYRITNLKNKKRFVSSTSQKWRPGWGNSTWSVWRTHPCVKTPHAPTPTRIPATKIYQLDRDHVHIYICISSSYIPRPKWCWTAPPASTPTILRAPYPWHSLVRPLALRPRYSGCRLSKDVRSMYNMYAGDRSEKN